VVLGRVALLWISLYRDRTIAAVEAEFATRYWMRSTLVTSAIYARWHTKRLAGTAASVRW
jgi:hypothetical protein